MPEHPYRSGRERIEDGISPESSDFASSCTKYSDSDSNVLASFSAVPSSKRSKEQSMAIMEAQLREVV